MKSAPVIWLVLNSPPSNCPLQLLHPMSQISFSDFEYAGKRTQTRRERFLAEMELVVPWSGLVALIEPHYPKAGGGRKPYPLETMLRIHLL